MNAARKFTRLAPGVLALAALAILPSCTSEYSGGGGGDIDVHGSFYYGVGYGPGFYGPPMYGPGYYPPPVIVAPPPHRPPPGPRPMPPMPRPMPR